MNVKEYLETVAHIDADCYYSNHDESYIAHLGQEATVEFLADLEITEQLTNGVGFSPKNNKWYGWNDQSILGFTIGSTCKMGDTHYIGSTLAEQEFQAIELRKQKWHLNVRCEGIAAEGENQYFDIKWNYSNDVPNERLRNQLGWDLHHIMPLGRGAWTAHSMADAHLMAIDFNQGSNQV